MRREEGALGIWQKARWVKGYGPTHRDKTHDGWGTRSSVADVLDLRLRYGDLLFWRDLEVFAGVEAE